MAVVAIFTISLLAALTCSFMLRQTYVHFRYGGGLLPSYLSGRPFRLFITAIILIVGLLIAVDYSVIAFGILVGR